MLRISMLFIFAYTFVQISFAQPPKQLPPRPKPAESGALAHPNYSMMPWRDVLILRAALLSIEAKSSREKASLKDLLIDLDNSKSGMIAAISFTKYFGSYSGQNFRVSLGSSEDSIFAPHLLMEFSKDGVLRASTRTENSFDGLLEPKAFHSNQVTKSDLASTILRKFLAPVILNKELGNINAEVEVVQTEDFARFLESRRPDFGLIGVRNSSAESVDFIFGSFDSQKFIPHPEALRILRSDSNTKPCTRVLIKVERSSIKSLAE
ncbi:MAG: hypothetical protein J0L93_03460 [Deltaproteobacteria bacterium]|nr:hypothetical protein [Deltaproteobacteria bacterium]